MELLDVKGLGPKSILKLNKLNIFNGNDLINYYPFRYEILKQTPLIENEKVIISGVLENVPYINRFGSKDRMIFRINNGNKIINVVIYNRGFLKTYMDVGKKITVIGKYEKNKIVASEIRFLDLKNEVVIEPVYRVVNGLTSKNLGKYIKAASEKYNEEYMDYIPKYLVDEYKFMNKKDSIKYIHNPINISKVKAAKIRLKYEELFSYMLRVNYLKLTNEENMTGINRNVTFDKVEDFISKLDFVLTSDQTKVVGEIFCDLNSNKRMNRLIQGDVGSGKTIVSIIALYINYLGGHEGVLMAPTEILARQHYDNIRKIFDGYNMNIDILTGKSDKKNIYNKLKEGKIDILIGTHALFQKGVIYNDLGLVITDEQHRFGVNQREDLKNKGITPDILYMSATPIPRTYALTLYGDMDVSIIKEKPLGRKEIKTVNKYFKEIDEVLKLILVELRLGNQIYVVAPLVKESEKIDLTDVYKLTEEMSKIFGNEYKLGIMHGKLKGEEKEKIINEFKNKKIQILVSTTVIEVGVDVKQATMMVIFNAERFGLATLHQLRGRVGRSDLQSYCILISDQEKERLKVMERSNDGFYISEEDFKLRGHGDLFGTRQSGDMIFKIADLKDDYKILIQAKKDSMEFLKEKKIEEFKYLNELIKEMKNLN